MVFFVLGVGSFGTLLDGHAVAVISYEKLEGHIISDEMTVLLVYFSFPRIHF